MTAATLASIVGSQPPAPTLASSRWTGPLSQHQSGPATFAPLVYPYIHTHASKQRRRLHHFAPTSSRPTPRPNPHSCCTSVPHLPRFRALALFGRRPHQCVARPSMTASENLHRKRHRRDDLQAGSRWQRPCNNDGRPAAGPPIHHLNLTPPPPPHLSPLLANPPPNPPH